MWVRFTQKAREATFAAVDEAKQHGMAYVGTEHVLLGIIKDNESVACRLLGELGVSAGALRDAITHELSQGDGSDDTDMQLTPRAKRVMDLAYEAARELDHKYIGTEHLLLGLLDVGSGLAFWTLSGLGVDGERVRVLVRTWLGELADRPATD